MPKYLIQASYTEKGLQAILKEGSSKRFEVVGNVVMRMGGVIEALYYALGETDVFMIVNLPDNVCASALSLVSNASGAMKVKTTVLVTLDEIEQATSKISGFGVPAAL